MNTEKYNNIRNKYGHVGSWSIWSKIDEINKPKYGVGNINIFDEESIIEKLNPNIVFVGLNISKKIDRPFSNFHSDNGRANDFKLRYAIQGSCLEGGYMTDIIKDFEEKISGKVSRFLRNNSDFLTENLDSFEKELDFIGCKNPIIIAFGNDVYNILTKKCKYVNVYKLTHYSARISKENFKKEVLQLIEKINK